MKSKAVYLAGLVFFGIAGIAVASAVTKPPLPYSVEDSWRSVAGPTVSNDGRWIAYAAQPELGDGTLIVYNSVTGKQYREARGGGSSGGFGGDFGFTSDVAFTADSRYLVFLIAPRQADVKAAERAQKKASEQPKAGLGILDLDTGALVQYDRVASFKVPNKHGDVVAILKETPFGVELPSDDTPPSQTPAGETKTLGAQLIIRDLRAGSEQTIDDVVDYGFTPDGSWIGYIARTAVPTPAPSSSPASAQSPKPTATPSLPPLNPTDGVYIRRVGDAESTAILTGPALFADAVFSKDVSEFAFITDLGTHTAKRPAWRLYYWHAGSASQASELVSASTPGILPGNAVSPSGPLEFSKDGQRLFLFTAPLPTPKPPANAEPRLKVDIWWSKEPDIPSVQKAEVNQKVGSPAMVRLPERRFLQLGTPTIETLRHNDNPHYALGLASVPYDLEFSWRYANCARYRYCDAYIDDLTTGQRRKIETMSWFEPTLSPEGKYIANFSPVSHHWYVIRTSDLRRVVLSAPGVHFEREDWDQADPPAAYGMMGWGPGDRTVYVYDHYDVWAFDPDTGAGRNVTAGYGRRNGIELRYVDMRPDQPYSFMPDFEQRSSTLDSGPIDTARQVTLLGFADATKDESLYRMNFGAPQAPTLLTQQSVHFGFPYKARNADVVVLTRERFDLEPDLYLTTMRFQSMRRISDVEPRQREYAWGHSRLIWYTNADGRRLQAVLTTPGNFDPRKKYPLLVFVYEDKSYTLNDFDQPEPEIGSEPTLSRYASNGYVILEPDIVYVVGHPGWSAVHCIVPAVQRVISMGFVDPKRIGMAGHSWGGFQSEFMLTHTHLFAAIAGGAGLSDLLSWNDELRSGLGNPGAAHLEIFQGRMGCMLWDCFNTYLENSSVFSAPSVTTPFLTLHNNTDSNVTQFQGIEMFLALRRLGKQAWLIDYNGEDHGIYLSRDDQKDWTIHMDQFLDHYLKGSPAPEWMLRPINYDERGTRQYLKLFDPAAE